MNELIRFQNVFGKLELMLNEQKYIKPYHF